MSLFSHNNRAIFAITLVIKLESYVKGQNMTKTISVAEFEWNIAISTNSSVQTLELKKWKEFLWHPSISGRAKELPIEPDPAFGPKKAEIVDLHKEYLRSK